MGYCATHQPSLRHQQNLQEKVTPVVNTVFSPVYPVSVVSASEGFNIPQRVETIIAVLPDNASSAVPVSLMVRNLDPFFFLYVRVKRG